MELKLKKELNADSGLHSKLGLRAALLVAGLAILPSCGPQMATGTNYLQPSAIGKSNPRSSEPLSNDLDGQKIIASEIVATSRKLCINPDMVESKFSETPRQNGVGIKYRTETRAVKQGDSVKVQGSPGNELYVKVVKVTDEGVGFSFEGKSKDSVWLIQYGEQRSIGEFVLRITIHAERCPEGEKALLVVTYPIGTADSKQDSPGSVVPRLPYRYGDSEHKQVQ